MWSIAMEQILLWAFLAVPALVMLFRDRLFPGVRSVWLFLGCCLVVYGLIMARVHLLDMRFEAELDAFDLDRDGSFSGPELTPEHAMAMDRVVSDTGRNLAPVTGIFLAPIMVAFSFGLVRVVAALRRLARRYRLRRS